MSKIYKYNLNEKATVCAARSCVTVYGDSARIINSIAIILAIVMALTFVSKAMR